MSKEVYQWRILGIGGGVQFSLSLNHSEQPLAKSIPSNLGVFLIVSQLLLYAHACARDFKSAGIVVILLLGNEVNCGMFVFHMYKLL